MIGKFLLAVLSTLLVAFSLGLYLPWWSIAFAGFGVALLIPQKPLLAFLSGFVALFLLWGALAFWIDQQNQGILSRKVSQLFPLQGSSLLLILITALLGALVAGLGALTGSFVRPSPQS